MAEEFTAPDGIRWRVRAAFLRQVADLGEGFLRAHPAELVKQNPYRRVFRVSLPSGIVYWKHCRLRGLRAWLRELLRAPKARLEHDHALRLVEHGIATVEPLAWGRSDTLAPSDSFLITRDLGGSQTLADRLANSFTPRQARELAVCLGQFLARLHDYGVTHPDLHPGNFLLEAGPQLHLIDLHAIRLGRPLALGPALANLAMLNRWFSLRVSRTDRLRAYRAYRAARHTLSPPTPDDYRAEPKELETLTTASNLRLWRSRGQRIFGNNKYFRKVKSPVARGYAVSDLDTAALARLAADPDAPFLDPQASWHKQSRSSDVVSLTFAGRHVFYKRFRLTTAWEPVRNLLRRSPALRAWWAGHALRDRLLPTPRPLAVLHKHGHFGLPSEGYLLCEAVPEARELTYSPERLLQVARLLRELHDRGMSHRDLKSANLLMSGEQIYLIDLVGVADLGIVPQPRRIRDLARLNASWPSLPRTDRLRFLRTYLRWHLHGSANWKEWWTEIWAATAAKVRKNARNGRVLA